MPDNRNHDTRTLSRFFLLAFAVASLLLPSLSAGQEKAEPKKDIPFVGGDWYSYFGVLRSSRAVERSRVPTPAVKARSKEK